MSGLSFLCGWHEGKDKIEVPLTDRLFAANFDMYVIRKWEQNIFFNKDIGEYW